jgi:hypothetical protein
MECYISLGQARSDPERCCKHIISIAKLVDESIPWLEILAYSAKALLSSHSMERKHLLKLLRRGIRRCRSYSAKSTTDHTTGNMFPFFGLSDPAKVLELLNTVERQIRLLRKIAQGVMSNYDDLVIRYSTPRDRHHSLNEANLSPYECASRYSKDKKFSKKNPF